MIADARARAVEPGEEIELPDDPSRGQARELSSEHGREHGREQGREELRLAADEHLRRAAILGRARGRSRARHRRELPTLLRQMRST